MRDWVINGAPANDVDCLLSDAAAVSAAVGQLQQLAQRSGWTVNGPRTKGAASTLTFAASDGSWMFDLDLVSATEVNKVRISPYVDCDAGNMKLTQNGLELKVRSTPGGTPLNSLNVSIQHCQRKQFEFYYDPNDRVGQQRLQKYAKKGWTQLPTQRQWWTL